MFGIQLDRIYNNLPLQYCNSIQDMIDEHTLLPAYKAFLQEEEYKKIQENKEEKKQKTLQELNLEDDFLFAKVMSYKEICRKVIEKILDIKIKENEMPEEQKVIDILLDSKSVRLDVYVNDDKGTVYQRI